MEWQPIETAPKDGALLVWSARFQRPVYVECRTVDGQFWCGDWDFDVFATHWLPLPNPPKA